MITKKGPVLPPLDKARIAAEARAEVERALKGLAGTEQIANVAGDLIARADEDANLARPERDRAALHLLMNDHRRGVARAMGVHPTRANRLTHGKTSADVVVDAEAKLVALAERVERANAINEAAEPPRNKAINALRKEGWTSEAIAQIAKVTPGRVRQVNLKTVG